MHCLAVIPRLRTRHRRNVGLEDSDRFRALLQPGRVACAFAGDSRSAGDFCPGCGCKAGISWELRSEMLSLSYRAQDLAEHPLPLVHELMVGEPEYVIAEPHQPDVFAKILVALLSRRMRTEAVALYDEPPADETVHPVPIDPHLRDHRDAERAQADPGNRLDPAIGSTIGDPGDRRYPTPETLREASKFRHRDEALAKRRVVDGGSEFHRLAPRHVHKNVIDGVDRSAQRRRRRCRRPMNFNATARELQSPGRGFDPHMQASVVERPQAEQLGCRKARERPADPHCLHQLRSALRRREPVTPHPYEVACRHVVPDRGGRHSACEQRSAVGDTPDASNQVSGSRESTKCLHSARMPAPSILTADECRNGGQRRRIQGCGGIVLIEQRGLSAGDLGSAGEIMPRFAYKDRISCKPTRRAGEGERERERSRASARQRA